MKRYTYWPQLLLGIIFSWGVIIVSIQFLNSLNKNFILLYFACIFWTLAYDTIYAYQDKKDDIIHGIKSTAVLLDKKGLKYVKFFYFVFFSIIIYLTWENSHNLFSLVIAIMFIFAMNTMLNKWNIKSRKSSNYYFKFNNFIGLCCFLFLLIF
jgi:4-hydroxybenzoate polyprenyltransferase